MWEKDTIPQKKIVTKYQPMEQLLHEIYVQAGMTKREPVGVQVATHGKVIGVVSPECHEMQELFSVMHAVNLGREQKVLYFNFLEFSGFRELFGQTGNFDFTDVVLKLRSGELTTEYFWNCVYEMSGISVILPFPSSPQFAPTTAVIIMIPPNLSGSVIFRQACQNPPGIHSQRLYYTIFHLRSKDAKPWILFIFTSICTTFQYDIA